jgi:hypothetical protein
LISWKHSFKRLNEEYDIAKRKKQALDNLYASGRISQTTRDSFDNEIVSAIAEIEKQQKDLLAKMESKVSELRSQIQTLEMLLANYEIQHVVGEIDEDTYQHEITLLSTGLDTAKHELDVIKEATTQLCPPPVTTAPTAPAMEPAPEVTTPMPETVASPAPEPVTAPSSPVENIPAPPAEVEAPPAPTEVETPLLCPQEPAAAAPEPAPEPIIVESPPEAVVEAAPEAPVETVVETPVETAEAVAEASVETVVEIPVETVEAVAEKPAETIEIVAEPQVEAPAETPVETIAETPEIGRAHV